MIPLALCAAAIAVLWWPRTRAEHRLCALAPTPGAGVGRLSTPLVLVVVVPAAALAMCGPAAGFTSAIIVGYLAIRRRRRVAAKRLDAADDQLTEALAIMVAEMSVGAPAAQACAAAARELVQEHPGSEVGEALARMAGRARLGGEAAADTVAGSAAPWRRIITVWQISDRYGLPMLDLLDVVRSDMVARRAFGARTRAGLAGPRATALVLAGLPILGIALGQAMGAAPLAVLLGDGLGGVLLVVGVALVVAGVAWSDRITGKVVGT